MPWKCFLIEAAEPYTDYLAFCGDKHRIEVDHLDVAFDESPDDPPSGWPSSCPECGRAMTYEKDEDGSWSSKGGGNWWLRPDTGERYRNQHEFGPGALFLADWWPDKGPDGHCYGVVCPPGGQVDIWLIDGPATGGGHWTRTGEAPNFTVTPSILTPNYHSFLTDGVLGDSLPDRPLPAST